MFSLSFRAKPKAKSRNLFHKSPGIAPHLNPLPETGRGGTCGPVVLKIRAALLANRLSLWQRERMKVRVSFLPSTDTTNVGQSRHLREASRLRCPNTRLLAISNGIALFTPGSWET